MESKQQRLARVLNRLLDNAHHVLAHDPQDEAVYRDLTAAAEAAARSGGALVWPPSVAEVETPRA